MDYPWIVHRFLKSIHAYVWHLLKFVGDHWESSGWLGGAPRVIKGSFWKGFEWFFEHSFYIFCRSRIYPGVISDHFLIFFNIWGPRWCDESGEGGQESSPMWCPAPCKNGFLSHCKRNQQLPQLGRWQSEPAWLELLGTPWCPVEVFPCLVFHGPIILELVILGA